MPKSIFSKRYIAFRRKLVEARLSAGLTQRSLANQLGHPQSYVSKYEIGERRIDLIEFLQLVEILNIDIYAFIIDIQQVPIREEKEHND